MAITPRCTSGRSFQSIKRTLRIQTRSSNGITWKWLHLLPRRLIESKLTFWLVPIVWSLLAGSWRTLRGYQKKTSNPTKKSKQRQKGLASIILFPFLSRTRAWKCQIIEHKLCRIWCTWRQDPRKTHHILVTTWNSQMT